MSHLNNNDLKALFVSGTAATPAKFGSLIDSSWNVIGNKNVLLGPTSATANAFDYYVEGYTGATGYIPGYTAQTGLWGLVGPTGSANGLWYEILNDVPVGLTGTTGTTGQIFADSSSLYISLGSGNWLVVGAGGGTGSGTQGIQGIQGEIGTQGVQGIQGIQGIQGEIGTGTQGTIGSQGIQGVIGTQGTIGSQGIQGRQGTVGIGVQGTIGSQGIQGTLGNVGPTGQSAPGYSWVGEWAGGASPTPSYFENELVGYTGNVYICVGATVTSATAPDIDTANWNLFISNFLQGPTGSQGATGYSLVEVPNNYTVSSSLNMSVDYTYYGIIFDTGATAITLNLPASAPLGTRIIIKDMYGQLGGNKKFIVTPNGSDKIDMVSGPIEMNIPFMSLTLMYNDTSTSWFRI